MGVLPRRPQARRAGRPLLLLMSGAQLSDLELRDDLFDDFCLNPFHPASWRPACSTSSGGSAAAPVPTSSSTDRSALNLETYQASIAGRPLDLTYMEYELLKFLAQHPGKVFTREMLLSRVWGYEYYGGARRSTSTSAACGQARRGARRR